VNRVAILALGSLLASAPPLRAATPTDSLTVATDSVGTETRIPAPDLSGYVQVRGSFREDVVTTTLNRVRVGAEGKLPSRLSYKIQLEAQSAVAGSNTAAVSLRDAWIRWSPPDFRVTAGQMDVPYSREWVMPTSEIETPDRSIVSEALAPRGDIGLVGLWTPRKQIGVTAGAFNGEGQNAIANRDSTTMFLGRVAVEPVKGGTLAAAIAPSGGDSTRYAFTAGIERGRVELWGEFLGLSRSGFDSRDEGWYGLLLVETLPDMKVVVRQEQLHRPGAPPALATSRGTTIGILHDLRGGRVRLLADYVRRTSGPDDRVNQSVLVQLQARFF
jgi:hypothetical protein